jgi:hypothetical protein
MGSVATPLWSPTRSDFPLRARHCEEGDAWLLELSGEADIATAALLRQELALLAATDRDDVVVDVTRLTSCDVASAHLILTARGTTPVTVRGATGSVKWMFDQLDALRMQRQTGYPASSRSGADRTLEARAWAS